MALESGSYINSLNAANPASTDGLAQADDHLRLIKSTVKSTFPSLTGAVTSTQADLNLMTGAAAAGVTASDIQSLSNATSDLQGQINGISSVPAGAILLWSGAVGAIPTGWVICDGTNSTPDLRDRFVVGAGSTYSVGATGGAATVTLSVAEMPSHTHVATSVVTDPEHTHDYAGVTGSSGAGASGRDSDPTTLTTQSASTGVTVATTNASTGSGTAHENRPPYYSLAYIMKTA